MIKATPPTIKCVIVHDRKLYGCRILPRMNQKVLDRILAQLNLNSTNRSKIRPVIFKSPRDMQFLDETNITTLKDGAVIHLIKIPKRKPEGPHPQETDGRSCKSSTSSSSAPPVEAHA
ncbi:hypothetical protein SeLEV6574_g02445 [Synchytrium endobioticum]|uniref:Uncharacterized protein n=1 Tax=Synchytrium endobioticum TaxID=286115 RepID=A0A507DAH7_9FUNG|nr:hypothetical protein SeLEV6574_g02445 [Synchytrium endobioticum]